MQSLEQLELPLWNVLKEATSAPDTANVRQLLDGLDVALLKLDTVDQLQVAAEAIAQIAQVFCDRSTLAFEELEATNSDDGPVMPEDAFDRYVRSLNLWQACRGKVLSDRRFWRDIQSLGSWIKSHCCKA